MAFNYGMGHLGVDYSIPPQALPVGSLADAANIIINDAGLITGRGGTSKLNNHHVGFNSTPMTSIFEYRNGSTLKKVCSYDTFLAYYDPATNIFIDYVTGLENGKKCQWVNFGGKALSINEGYDRIRYFDGTSGGLLAAAAPYGKTICEWSSRVWIGGDVTNPALLTGSYLSDPTDWTSTTAAIGIVQQYVGDTKDPITGVFGFFDWLLVGKRNQLFRLSGSTPTDSSTLSIVPVFDRKGDSVGFTSPWAITQVGNDCIFLDGFDIKRLSGILEFGDVESISVIPHFREYIKSIADKDYIQYSKFHHYKNSNQIWVSIPTSATTHYVFVLDYKNIKESGRFSIYPMSNLQIVDFCGVSNGSIDDIYASTEEGIAIKLDCPTNDDYGNTIPRHFTVCTSGAGVENSNEYRKQFHRLNTFIKPTLSTLTMTPSYLVNAMDSEQIRTGTYTGLNSETISSWTGTGVKRKDIRLFGVNGKSFALKWTHNAVAENFIMQPSTIDYEFKSRVDIGG
jgi:hypothetical protein